MKTAATIFSGGGGADIGLSDAGLDVLWGIEYDDDIASVARENGLHIRTGDVREVDAPSDVDLLHASPPCPNFSVAKTGAEETGEDVSLARATVRFIREIQPKAFTLENVWGYRKSESWKLIREHLQRSGYDWNAWKLNAADYGVPQTRKRMIVAAIGGGPRPTKPDPTHAEDPPPRGLFEGMYDEWVGWHEAIEDLIPSLPETELADWQKERLPDELLETAIVDTQPNARGDCRQQQQQPTKTVAADPAGGAPRAVLVHGSDTRGCPQRGIDETSFSVISNGNTKGGGANVPRAILCGTNTVDGEAPPTREDDTPALTQRPNDDGRLRAVLIDPQNTSRDATEIEEKTPAMTVSGWHGRRPSHRPVALTRRVVQMTTRCLARFQSFPDWYDLPESKSLACRIIGNAVPPLLMQRIAESLIEDITLAE